ncbi:MAG: imidazolonepropionase [Gemmatimonadales bacterium]|nr:MAG: imidazolonepropionase [Gemmatimonadales bacterium]
MSELGAGMPPGPSSPGGALLIREARVVTPVPPGFGGRDPGLAAPASPMAGYLRGNRQGELRVMDPADVRIRGRRIEAVGPRLGPPSDGIDERVLEAGGRVLLPGFVDAHTHACWAGERMGEWEARLAGATYQEILAAGGGILSTVEAVRASSEEALADALLSRLGRALVHGTTTMEVKSGYGLTGDAELRMLRAIGRAGDAWAGEVVPTGLLGHAIDPAWPGGPDAWVDHVISEVLPRVTAEFPRAAIDAYCEEGAWSVGACVRLFSAARAAGHPVRVHADQFRDLGMVEEAIRMGARSADHLEASGAETLRALGDSDTAGVLLPVSGFHLDGRYADGRALLDAGGAVVVATNWNPGSAPSPSIPLALALATRENGLTVGEAIAAVTWNAAVLLGLPDRGWVGAGARADLVLFGHRDERELAHTVGENAVDVVVAGGRVVVGNPVAGESRRMR